MALFYFCGNFLQSQIVLFLSCACMDGVYSYGNQNSIVVCARRFGIIQMVGNG